MFDRNDVNESGGFVGSPLQVTTFPLHIVIWSTVSAKNISKCSFNVSLQTAYLTRNHQLAVIKSSSVVSLLTSCWKASVVSLTVYDKCF